MKFFIVLFAFILILSSCRHTPNFNSLTAVKYSSDIEPIIISNCTQSSCHGTIDAKKFKLLTYDDVIKHCEVKGGSPENSKLYNVITTYNSSDIMPTQPYSQLTDKQIQKIYVWIGQGALNN